MSSTISGEIQSNFVVEQATPVGVIYMPGTEKLADNINHRLLAREQVLDDGVTVKCRYGPHQDSFLIKPYLPRFASGEGKAVLPISVRGLDLYILFDFTAKDVTYNMYGSQNRMSPDDHFADLKRVISATGGRAKKLTVIMPMLYEGRQHRRDARESMDCAIMLQELEAMGVDEIVTYDAHDPRIENAIPFHGFDNILPTFDILKALLTKEKNLELTPDKLIVVSPDEGAMQRNMYYSAALGVDMGMFYKQRDYSRIVNGKNPIREHRYLGDSVEGKDIFVADDMIATGDSILDLCKQLKARGAGRVFLGASFGLFTAGMEPFDRAFANGDFDRILCTNLTSLPAEVLEREWFTMVDMSSSVAMAIAALNHNESIRKDSFVWNRTQAMLDRYRRNVAGR